MDACWTDATVTLPDGRKLGYCGWGDPAGRPVLHFHGALTSRYEGFWLHPAARAHGIKLLTLDRPGVGNSDYVANRRIADWPRDMAGFADALGIGAFGVVGVSGGGPYALACAHALPARVDRVALIAGAAPIHEPAVFALMSGRQQVVLGGLMKRPRLLRAFLQGIRLLPNPLRMLAVTATLGGLAPADLAIVRSREITERVKQLPRVAESAPFGVDSSGPTWDGHLHSMPWGFALAEVRQAVDLWYAEDDRIVSANMGRWLQQALPQTRPHFLPGEGHLSLILGKAHEFMGALA